MQYVFYIFAVLICGFATLILYIAWNQTHSGIHEIAAFVVYGVGAVFMVGGAIVGAMKRNQPQAEQPRRRVVRRRGPSSADPSAVDALEQMDSE